MKCDQIMCRYNTFERCIVAEQNGICPMSQYKKAAAPMTNGDRIRAMSDTKLGEFLCDNMAKDCGICPGAKYCSEGNPGLIKWLELPAEGEDLE